MDMKIVFIISGVMALIGFIANIAASIMEKKYKEKMNSISKKE